MRKKLMESLRRAFRPEFINRLDSVIVFRALTRDEIKEIVSLELIKVQNRLQDRRIQINATEAAKAFLAEKGYDQDYGARPLRRVIQNEVEDKLSDGFLSGRFKEGDTVMIDLLEGNLDFQAVREPETPVVQEPVLA